MENYKDRYGNLLDNVMEMKKKDKIIQNLMEERTKKQMQMKMDTMYDSTVRMTNDFSQKNKGELAKHNSILNERKYREEKEEQEKQERMEKNSAIVNKYISKAKARHELEVRKKEKKEREERWKKLSAQTVAMMEKSDRIFGK